MYQKIENDYYFGGDVGDGDEDGSVNAWVSKLKSNQEWTS